MTQTFAELGLNPDSVAGLEALGYERPSKVQRDVIPHLLVGRDAVIEAAPGSGKTAAYALPILQTLNAETEGIQVLVFVPTGNDAMRVSGLLQALNYNQNIHIVPVFEEQPIARESERLDRTVSIVVGTPERIKQHADRASFGLEQVQVVVIDDFDHLVTETQMEALETVLEEVPGSRQTIVLTTQLDEEIEEFADQHLFEPLVLKAEFTFVAMPLVKHRYQNVAPAEKPLALLRLLDGELVDRGLVYVNLRPDAERVAQLLRSQGYHAGHLHSRTDSETRERLVRNWHDGNLHFIVLTDAAAAGLNLETGFVISYDVPTDAETYAARARVVAENGSVFTLVTPRERPLLAQIESFLGVRVKAVLPPTRADLVVQRSETFKQTLRDVIARSNLEIYMLLLNELAEEGYDWSELAAAAVSLVQMTQAETIFTRRAERRPPPAAAPVPPAPRPREVTRERPREEEREVEAGYVRLIMDAGYDIGVRPKDIVGAIANEANIPGRAVGNIDIRDRFTYVEIQEEYIDRVLNRVPSTRLRGRVVTFRRA